jgi:Superfamily II DNA/RNA helicases, SNF2 family
MTRNEAVQFAHDTLNQYGLRDWHVRLTTDMSGGFLGMCVHKDKCLIISALHIDIHDEKSVKNTIRHEVAHALTPGHSHDSIWRDKAREIGCDNTEPCSNLSFTPEAIDAIRSGATLEVEIEEQIIRTPKYKVTRLQQKCEECGKVAVEKRSYDLGGTRVIELRCGHNIFRKLPKVTPYEKFISADADPKCEHKWQKNFCQLCDAKRPFKFQVDAMRFIETGLAINKGIGVFDEMGLGKTIDIFGYIKYHTEAQPVLFVVKSGIIFQMYCQSMIWLGDNFVGQVIRTSADPVIKNLKLYFISYDLLVPKTRKLKSGKIVQQGFDIQKLLDRKFQTIVLDECQLIKNPDSSRTQQVRRLVKEIPRVVPLSGTPWKNRGSEFYPVLQMIAPMKFNSHQGFIDRWVEFHWEGNKYKEGGIRNIPAFKEYVKDIIIRREYNDVMDEYPEVTRTLHYFELDGVKQEMYDEEVSDFVKWWNAKIIGGEETDAFGSDNIAAKIQRMRHILGIAKIPATLEYVADFVEETDRKLVIFVHHIDVGQILYDKLKEEYGNDMPVLKLTANLSSEDRFELQNKFNSSSRALMVASTLAAGEGINLQTCSDAILHERQWNPANEDQAAPGRFKRIGQLSSHINVVCVTGHDTVDDFFHGIVEKKRKYFHSVHNASEMPVWNHNDIMHELGQAIVDSHNRKQSNIKKMVTR